jgi:serralysin
MNGISSNVSLVSLTGIDYIDGLSAGVKWSDSSITCSNPDSASDYQVGYYQDADQDGIGVLTDGFSQFTSAQLTAMHAALNTAPSGTLTAAAGFAVEGFTNLQIDFAGAGTGNATIRGANSADVSTAYAMYPSTSIYGGDTFFANYASIYSPAAGNYGWHTMLHELGHSLGLKHGHEGTYVLPSSVDSVEFSVMTYRTYVGGGTGGYSYTTNSAPQTYMMMDIAALQSRYGANYSVNSSSTTYTWNSSDGTTYVNGSAALDPDGNTIFATIWDGGGYDTYDLSNYSTNLSIDLEPGKFSTFDSAQLANLGGMYARGNIANALLFGGDTRSLIENATGGSGNDTLSGNTADNSLIGNNGADTLYGLSGGDYLSGGAGNDVLDGGAGVDLMAGGTGDDIYYIDNFYDVVAEASGAGFDTIYSSASYEMLDPSGYFELAALTGSSNISFIGNVWAQRIVGNIGNNRLDGMGGNDSLNGGSGADTFVFSTAPSGSNIDTIEDMSIAQGDLIELARSVYSTLNAGSALLASAFRIGTTALDGDDRIFYNSGTGALFYDSDGTGSSAAVQFATLSTGLALGSSNFTIA